ncbi:hypothetical protein TGRH88_060580 [Toxoplasma gondii]|uniref:Uncharacterized protein n=1 Tax=Toxoplasma gondii TaxID=5811 RepID=A0A7J6JVA4_TOXGO|nr:hypothetical protein TGRH88_060580 [Toxoplasma gondii]
MRGERGGFLAFPFFLHFSAESRGCLAESHTLGCWLATLATRRRRRRHLESRAESLRTSRRRPGFRERESRKKCRMHAPDGSDPSRAGRRARLKRGRRRGSALQRWLAEETETGRSRASSRQRRVNRKSENGGRAA